MRNSERGQALVEMAIISPILIIMLLGMFEVGAAIRAYMTVLNANREAARFVARGLYTDDQAYEHFNNVLSPTVLSDISNTTVYVRRFDIKAGDPFTNIDDMYSNTLRVWGSLHPSNVVVAELAAKAIGLNNTVNMVQYGREVAMACPELPPKCAALKAHNFDIAPIDWHEEQFVYVEAHYDHDQVIGFFGNFKIPLYTQTMMRINSPRGF